MWYDLNIESYNLLSWKEIEEAFLQAYGGHSFEDQILTTKLANLTQKQNQSIRSYFLILQWILKHCPDHRIPDGLIKDVFVNGLRGHSKNQVVAQSLSHCTMCCKWRWIGSEGRALELLKGKSSVGFVMGFDTKKESVISNRE